MFHVIETGILLLSIVLFVKNESDFDLLISPLKTTLVPVVSRLASLSVQSILTICSSSLQKNHKEDGIIYKIYLNYCK